MFEISQEDRDVINMCHENRRRSQITTTIGYFVPQNANPPAAGEDGEDGGYYTPSISQPDDNTMTVSFTPSKAGMEEVPGKSISLPAGPTGTTPNIQIGAVETLPAGSEATADISGTPENPVLNLGIPQGSAGSGGGGGIAVTGATVGQTVRIAAVDENGVPTAWEPVDFPADGERDWSVQTYDFSAEFAASVKLELPSSDIKEAVFAYSIQHDGVAVTSTTVFRIYADVVAVSSNADKWVANGSGLFTTIRNGVIHYEEKYPGKAYNESSFNGTSQNAVGNLYIDIPKEFFYIVPTTSGVLIKGTATLYYR